MSEDGDNPLLLGEDVCGLLLEGVALFAIGGVSGRFSGVVMPPLAAQRGMGSHDVIVQQKEGAHDIAVSVCQKGGWSVMTRVGRGLDLRAWLKEGGLEKVTVELPPGMKHRRCARAHVSGEECGCAGLVCCALLYIYILFQDISF